jgi:hypothetical protein
MPMGVPLYALPAGLGPLEAVRGTIFFLDWRWLRDRKDYDRYAAAVQPAVRDALLGVTTGDWVPVELLQAHYRALDSMGFTREQAVSCGVSVGEALHGSMLRTLVRLAGHLGATPWAAFGQAQKLWSRSWRGAGVLPYRLGDKSARFEVTMNGAARSAFHRGSVAGALSVGIGWLCQKHVIQEIDGARREESFLFQIDWV